MSATPTQLADLAEIIAQQARGIAEGRFPHPDAMHAAMVDNIDALYCWSLVDEAGVA